MRMLGTKRRGVGGVAAARVEMRAAAVVLLVTGLAMPACGQAVGMMAVDARPAFEVATIKRTPPEDQNQGFHSRGHRVQIENETLTSMIMFAYGVHAKQILGGPEWLGSERYDVDGVADVPGEPNLKQYQAMVRGLLEERFGLKMHREQRELAIYAITVGKGGSKLVKSAADPLSSPDQTGNGDSKQQKMKFTNNTMDEFALGMQYFMARPVVNQTGLTGRYDFTLQWATDERPDADTGAAPGMLTAIQEQLGLKLEATKGMAEVVVIDGVTRPSAN